MVIHALPIGSELLRCSSCGFCQTACPIFKVTGREMGVARGRISLLKAIAEDTLQLSPDLEPAFFECLLCRACTAHCFPAIRTDRLMVAAREMYHRKSGQPEILKIIFHELLPHRARMDAVMRGIALGKSIGLNKILHGLAVFGWFSKRAGTLTQANEIIRDMPRSFLRDLASQLPLVAEESEEKADVGYFVGCGINYMLPETGRAALNALAGTGKKIRMLDNLCCGLPAYSHGDLDAAKNLARANIDVIAASAADLIVTECASCSSFLKEYPALLADDQGYAAKAAEFSARVRDFTEIIAESIDDLPLREKSVTTKKVTYHDPCHLSRYQGLKSAPRKILRSLPDIEFVEMPEADWCCGGAGSFNIEHYDLSMKVLERKMNNAMQTSAEIIATSCPACIIQLKHGAANKGRKMEIVHIAELISTKIEK